MGEGSQKIQLKKQGLVSHDTVGARTESLQLSEYLVSASVNCHCEINGEVSIHASTDWWRW